MFEIVVQSVDRATICLIVFRVANLDFFLFLFRLILVRVWFRRVP